jgi:predicted dehydrogenase
VGHIERFNPATQVACQLCGPPKYIRAERLSPYAFRSTDIGVVLDVMIHDLDLILDLVRSPIVRVEAFGISLLGEHEDSVQARLQFENGCIADLTANRVSPTVRRTLQVWSERGCVQADLAAREVVAYRPSEKLLFGKSPLVRSREPGADIEQLKAEIFGQYIEVLKPEVPAVDALTAELRSFVDCIREKRQPLVSGQEAQRALLAAEQVLQCVNAHQWDGCATGAIGPLSRPALPRRLAG